MARSVLEPAPFSGDLGLSPEARARVAARLEAVGVRRFPFPFSSAMSIVSDCDSADRDNYLAYTEAFARRGLDFGDSTWLHSNRMIGLDIGLSLGFFFYNLSESVGHDERWMTRARTFRESVAGFHLGQIDHFHTFLRDGPRVVVVDCPAGDGEVVEVAIPPLCVGGVGRTEGLRLFGLLIEGGCESADVIEKDGTQTTGFRRLTAPSPRDTLFALPFDPDAENHAPAFQHIDRVRLGAARNVTRVILLSSHSDLLVERVARLRRFNVEMSLVTSHASFHFRRPNLAPAADRAMAERLGRRPIPLESAFGTLTDEQGLVFSTDADDPRSVCRVLPELFDLGLRFMIIETRSSEDGLDPLEVLSPTPTRSGGGGYWARRVLPLGVGPSARSQLGSFTLRVRRALAEAERAPGAVWPIYTHLGAIERPPGQKGPPPCPDPYLDEADMRALQDSVFGMSGRGPRVWLARASTLYDYCLVLQAIGDHVERRGDRVDITSWRDPVLGVTLPCSPAQLYGLTFHVDDAAAAAVRLDGTPLLTLARNRADETGRQSVTILESEIEAIVFRQLDPLENHPEEARIVGACAWRDGRLEVDGEVTLPLHGWRAPSAQALCVDAEGVFGVRLRTEGGGAFYFGDPRWADGRDDAVYAFDGRSRGRFVAPFHDLTWRHATGLHGPSQALASVTLIGAAKFAGLSFLRPRATTLRRDGFCVVGRVAGFTHGEVVRLAARRAGSADRRVKRQAVDQRGWFCFPNTPVGVYRLTSQGRCDGRGPWIEVGSDAVGFVLDRVM